MCNKLHDDYKKISQEGKAYKLVCLDSMQRWAPLVCHDLYKFSAGEWICWDDTKSTVTALSYSIPMGFCFIPTLEGALKAYKEWGKRTCSMQLVCQSHEILEIDYRQGLGRFIEPHFVAGLKMEVLLAKEFKIIRKVYPKPEVSYPTRGFIENLRREYNEKGRFLEQYK